MRLQYVVCVVLIVNICETAKPTIEGTTATAYPCNEHKSFVISLELSERPQDQENKYFLYIHYNKLLASSKIYLKFTDGVNITLASNKYGVLTYFNNKTEARLTFYRDKIGGSRMHVTSLNPTQVSYITSISINNAEKCMEPNVGVFNDLLKGPQGLALSLNQPSGPMCGRRQLIHTELITNSIQSKPGDWPWHVAIYRQDRQTFDYKCGGTLLSKNVILTAGHCVMKKGLKKRFPKNKIKAYLGKYNLYEADSYAVERQIEKLKVHEQYDITTVNNDIALMQLKSEIEYNEYIQPACLWDPEIFETHKSDIYGTVVGWGFDTTDRLSPQLRQATMPIIDGFTCVLSNHIFFGKYLNEYKFCAGYKNGTSPCNGDSGGGFVIFAPDRLNNNNYLEGSWYVKGIVSIGVSRREISICQPNEYVLFTDIARYKDWIKRNMNFNNTKDIDEPETEITETLQAQPSNPATQTCGQKKLLHTELVVNGQQAKPGDWPWHAAIHRMTDGRLKYLCGGTLLSRNVVLSGGTCVANLDGNGGVVSAEIVEVMLGKFNLDDNIETNSQTKKVAEIVIHEKFTREKYLDDISLIRLKPDAVFTDYVQPICLWNRDVHNRIDRFTPVIGTVPGWGVDETGVQTSTLHQAQMPIVSDGVCARSSDLFKDFSYNKFCAGFINGTSVCIGDSGGAMAVFVPYNKSTTQGAWYARGIVSLASSSKNQNSNYRCDPTQYVLFTDLDYYTDWIGNKMASWIYL